MISDCDLRKKEKLKNIVIYAYEHVPYYRESIKEDVYEEFLKTANIKCLPILTKRDVISNYSRMFSDEVVLENMLWESTSGTSGIPLKIGKTKLERSKMALRLMRWRRDNFRIGISDAYAYFITIDTKTKFMKKNNVYYLSEIHLDDDTLERDCEIIQQNNIVWIYSTPSVINVLRDFMCRKKILFPSVKYIELTGEYISHKDQQDLIDFFGCPIGVQYGITEVWSVAQECKCGELHLMEDDVVLEEGDGMVYVTSLESFGMPFIRYAVDDEISNGKICLCGSDYKTINIIKSRTQEYFYVGNRRLSPIMLRIAINEAINENPDIGITQYQFVQNSVNSLHCYVGYKDSTWLTEEISVLLFHKINLLYRLPLDFKILVIKVDDFRDRIKSGKLGYFLSKINKEFEP